MTLTVAVPAAALVWHGSMSRDVLPVALCFIFLPILGGLAGGRRRLYRMLCLAILGLAGMAGGAASSGCGGSSSGSGTSTPPQQPYQLTVTATSGGVSNNPNLTLIVK